MTCTVNLKVLLYSGKFFQGLNFLLFSRIDFVLRKLKTPNFNPLGLYVRYRFVRIASSHLNLSLRGARKLLNMEWF